MIKQIKQNEPSELKECMFKTYCELPIGIIIMNSEQQIVEINDIALELSGYRRDELIGKKCHKTLCPALEDNCPVLHQHKDIDRSEKILIDKNGKEIDILTSVIKKEINSETYLIETIEDVSSMRKNQNELVKKSKIDLLRISIWEHINVSESRDALIQSFIDDIGEHLNLDNLLFINMDHENNVSSFEFEYNKREHSVTGLSFQLDMLKGYFGKHYTVINRHNIPPTMKKEIMHIYDKYGIYSTLNIAVGDKDNPRAYLSSSTLDPDKIWNQEEINLLIESANILDMKLNQLSIKSQLEETKTFYKNIFENFADLYLRSSLDGRIETLSPSVKDMLGYSPEELYGSNIKVIYTDLHDREEFIRQLKKTGSVSNYELRLKTKKGNVKTCSVNAHFIYDSDGNPQYIEGSLHDITNIKQIEKALFRSQERFQMHFEYSSQAIIEVTNKLIISAWNPAAERIFGFSGEESIGKRIDELIIPHNEKDRAVNLLDELKSKKESIKTINRNITKSGKTVICEWYETPLIDKNGQFLGIMSTAKNITEDIKNRKSLEQLSKAVEQSPASIVITDKEGDIEYVNKKFTDITGYSYDDAIGENPRILNSGEQDKGLYTEMWDTILSGNEWTGQLRNKTKDGRLFWEQASISPMLDEEGRISHFVAVKEDITLKKQRQEELKQTKKQLEIMNKELLSNIDMANQYALEAQFANEAKSRFLANMSHEIRTPMNGIMGMLGLLQDTSLDESQHEYAGIAQSSAESLLSLINDILDFSKIESGKLEMEETSFNLQNILEELNDMLGLRAQQSRIEYAYLIPGQIQGNLIGDSGRLRQVLVNLLGNAVKFTEEGSVNLIVTQLSSDEEKVRLEFSVEDTGIGIKEEKLEKIFETFSQAESGTTRKYGGTGLGLTISKKLVELMGGELTVESTEGEGSKFRFDVEFRKDNENICYNELNNEMKEIKILAVDDNEINRKLLDVILSNWQIEDYTVTDDSEGVLDELKRENGRGNPYDIVLLDMQMPDRDGIDIAGSIKNSADVNPSVILMTSMLINSKEENISSVIDDYITKPIKKEKLLSKILKLVNKAQNIKSITDNTTVPVCDTMNAYRILLVEDNITNQKVASMILKNMGHKVDVAANGAEALESFKSISYDLILMDVQMPVMDGYEASRRIRETGSNVPILAMTADVLKGTREKCINSGMNDYISKPVNPDTVSGMISKWMERKDNDGDQKEALSGNGKHQFDIDSLAESIGGSMDIALSIMEEFIVETEESINEIRSGLNDRDTGRIRAASHKIKGSAATVGAQDIHDITRRMQEWAESSSISKIDASIGELSDSFNRMKNSVSDIRK
ncbi:MAG: PAS domain S-box protein [bacterium]